MQSGLRLSVFCLFAAGLPAQTLGYNEILRFGASELVQGANNTTTGFALEATGAQPAAFSTGSVGVAAGSLTFVWYPSLLNARYTDRLVTGHVVAVRPSSATPAADYVKTASGQTAKGVPLYIPKFSILAAKARPAGSGSKPVFGWGYEPDFARKPLFQYTTNHSYLETKPDTTRVWYVTYNTPTKIPSSKQPGASREMVLGFEWKGGEHISKAGGQSIPSGFAEKEFAPVHWGFATPGPNRTRTFFDATKALPGQSGRIYTSPFAGYLESEATVAFHSDWGENRNQSLGSLYPSYNLGSALGDIGSTAGACGFDVFTKPGYAGYRALPLINLGGPNTTGTTFLGQGVEVSLTNPFLSFGWGNPLIDGVINKEGVWLPSKRVAIPKMAAAVGTWVGMEFVIANPKTGQIVDTTNAYWFYIEK